MRDSKLYTIIQGLNTTDRNRLHKYILSPYFNVNENLTLLFEILESDIRKGNDKTPEPEKLLVWTTIYGLDKSYDDVRFRKLCSELLKLIEGFLAQEVYQENTLHQAAYLLEAVNNRKMEKLYSSSMKTSARLSEVQYHKPASYYYYQYQIEKNNFELSQYDLERSTKTNVEKITSNLDRFYLAEKMKYYCDVLNRKDIISRDYEILFINEIIVHIQKFGYAEIPPISIYYQIYLCQSEPDNESHYFKLKELINKYSDRFPQSETEEIYGAALNYCNFKANSGKLNFAREYFELYQEIINKNYILNNEELSPWRFRNIVLYALRIGEYNWVENFIETYKDFIPESHKSNAVTYNMAQLYFYKKEYGQVLKQIQNVEYDDTIYILGSKSMLIATYYELDEYDPLLSLLESFKTYLNRQKNTIPENRRQNYLNLIRFVKKLTQITSGDEKALNAISEELNKVGSVSENWLREKIKELY